MKALLQRVSEAAVSIAGEEVARIGPGLLVFLGVVSGDDEGVAARLADKTLGLRIFPDEAKPMNRDVTEVDGQLLVVSQFTLAADTRRGRRPSFTGAAPPELAELLYQRFIDLLRQAHPGVESGRFGADMQVALVNDGPVTILLDIAPEIASIERSH